MASINESREQSFQTTNADSSLDKSAIPAGTFVDGSFVTESGDLTAEHSIRWVDLKENKETRTFRAATLAQAQRIKEEKEKDKDISDVQIHSEGLYAVLDGTGTAELGMRIDAAKAARKVLKEMVQHDKEASEKIELIPMLEYYKRQYPEAWHATQ